MTERPILMSAPMVRALIAGTKTQTRRVIRPQPTHFNPSGVPRLARPDGGPSDVIRCPYGGPGDRLWVREAHAFSAVDPDGRDWREDPENWDVIYRADEQPAGGWVDAEGNVIAAPWRPSIHMPRWASRITLEITHVRVHRLQEISNADSVAEGAAGHPDGPWHAFRSLWTLINGAESWDANPWVRSVHFRRVNG